MLINVNLLTIKLSKRSDNGAAKQFLTDVPMYIKNIFAGNITATCSVKKVLKRKKLFFDLRENGMQNPLIIFWDAYGMEIDGYHRLSCFIALGHEKIEAVLGTGIPLVFDHLDDIIQIGWPILQDIEAAIKKYYI